MSDAKPSEGEAAPKKGKKGLIIGLVILLAAGGGGGWWYMNQAKAKKPPADQVAGADAHEEEVEEEVAHAKPKDKVFVEMDRFTTNLADEEGDHVAQIALALELSKPEHKDILEKQKPIMRDRVIYLISAQTAKQLRTPEGKDKLAKDIQLAMGELLGWEAPEAEPPHEEDDKKKKKRKAHKPNPVKGVHFSQFIVQ